jgi:hypothetical protein
MKAIVIKYGLISASIIIFISLGHYILTGGEMNFELGEVIGYSSMIISMVAVYFGIRNYRDNHLQGEISFGKAFAVGAAISCVAGLIFGVYVYVLIEYITPDFGEKYMAYYIDQIKNSGASADQIKKQLDEVAAMQKGVFGQNWFQGILMFFTVFPIGLILTFLFSFLLKTKKKDSVYSTHAAR